MAFHIVFIPESVYLLFGIFLLISNHCTFYSCLTNYQADMIANLRKDNNLYILFMLCGILQFADEKEIKTHSIVADASVALRGRRIFCISLFVDGDSSQAWKGCIRGR